MLVGIGESGFGACGNRSGRMGVFSRIFAALAGEAGEPDRLIIDSTHLKARRTVASLLKRGRLIGASASPRAG
jgi:hypothetical protein